MEQKTFSSKPQSFSNNQPSQSHHHYHHHHYHSNQNESKFYVISSIELKDQLENNLEESYTKLQNLINPTQSQQPENIQFNELSQYANQSKAHYDEISNALLYSILTDPSNSARCLRNLFLCNNLTFSHNSNDPSQNTQTSSSSYVLLITNLLNIITENYFRLLDTPRQQLLWLLKELVKTRVNQFDKLLLQMLRNIQSGLLSDKNIWLAESILEILYDQTTTSCSNNTNLDQPTMWLYSYNELMTQSVYTYLRLISDHSQSSALSCLKQRETEFCCQVLREKWNECMLIGRDLVRLLQNLAKINEFNTLWKDIMTSPQNLSPQFAQLGGLIYLLRLPTRKRCLISRLTVDMERKIYFIITSVKAGQQKRYLEWFQRQYLNTAESQSLRIDLIRYICVVVHPTNEQLNAGLTPRWSLCAWLLNTCTSLIDTANLKLALFFDWIIYDAKKDNIMLIEPGILLMYYSIRQNNLILNNLNNINLTTMLFDFLCRIATNFFWPIKDFILNGIMQSFKDSVEKRVIPSLQVFFNSVSQPVDSSSGSNNKEKHQGQPILDRDIRNLIQSTFGNFFQTLTIPTLSNSSNSLPSTNNNQQQIVKPIFTTTTLENAPVQSSTITASSINFGSNQLSLFKNKQTDDIGLITPSLLVTSSNQTNFSSNANIDSIKSEFMDDIKNEPVNFITIDNNSKQDSSAIFSDEEENNSNINLVKSDENEFNEDTNDSENSNNLLLTNNFEGNSNMTNPSPSTGLTLLEEQLRKFSAKPLKIFSIIDETTSNTKSNNLIMQSLDNHLNLIPSDDLRNKLIDINDKLTNNTISNNNKISYMMKDILNCMCRDHDFLNNFGSSLTDLAVSICLIFKNDFNNSLLPLLFYSSNSSSENSKLVHNDIDLISINTFLANPNYISLINETINQRPIFLLFKELSMTTNQSHEREILLQLLNEMYLKQNRIGYYFIYYIYYVYLNSKVSNSNSSSLLNNSSISMSQQSEFLSLIRIYHEFIKERHNQQSSSFNNIKSGNFDNEVIDTIKSKNINYEPISSSSSGSSPTRSSSSLADSSDDSDNENSEDNIIELTEHDLLIGNYLMQDIRLCQQDDSILFLFLLSFILNNNNNLIPSTYLINNSELIYLIVSSIDSKQLKDILVSIISQDIVLLRQSDLEDRTKLAISTNKKNKKSQNTSKESLNNMISKKRKRKNSANNKNSNKKISSNCKKGNISYKKEELGHVLKASLYWETVEQIFFWELLKAHNDIDLDYLLPIFNSLDTNRNSEAVVYLFKLIKQSEPTFDLVKYILKRNVDDNVTRALFINWTKNISSGPTKIAQIFVKILNKTAMNNQKQIMTKKIKLNESFSSNTKKPTVEQQLENLNNSNKENMITNSTSLNDLFNNQDEYNSLPDLDQVLSHLNKLRLNDICIDFILKDNLLETLKKIYKNYSDEDMRKKYADLFTLVDESNKSDSSFDDDHDEEMGKNEGDEDNEKCENDENETEENNKNKRKKNNNNKNLSEKRYNNQNKKNTAQNKASTSDKTKKSKKQKANNNSDSERDLKSKKKDAKSSSGSEDVDDSENASYNSDRSASSSNYSSSDEYSKALKQNLKKSAASGKNKKNKSKSSTQQPPSKKLKKQNNSDNISD